MTQHLRYDSLKFVNIASTLYWCTFNSSVLEETRLMQRVMTFWQAGRLSARPFYIGLEGSAFLRCTVSDEVQSGAKSYHFPYELFLEN